MPPKTPSRTVLNNKIARLNNLRKKKRFAEIIAEGAETPFWEALKAMWGDKLNTAESALNNNIGLTPDQRTIWLERKIERSSVITACEDMADMIESYAEAIAKLEKEIEDYRAGVES